MGLKILQKIERKLREFKRKANANDLRKIILSVVSSQKSIILDRVDNSDLNTLLLLATKQSQVMIESETASPELSHIERKPLKKTHHISDGQREMI